MAPKNKIVLLACGSFNPPTIMHLRMFELARDKLHKLGQYLVVGGIISPVHDSYGKKELVPATLRCEMLKLAVRTSDWIGISDWECSQEQWYRTRQVLQYHQNFVNSVLSDRNRNSPRKVQKTEVDNGLNTCHWVTNELANSDGPIQVKLLCGADLLESFATPGLWSDTDIETIVGQHGLIVITRCGSNPQQFIYESDVLTRYQNNIIIVPEWITNDVSSTKIRRALRRHDSVKYLVHETVIEFINKHGLYGSDTNDLKYCFQGSVLDNLMVPNSYTSLTPSPSDVNMLSASPSLSGNDIVLNLNPIDNMNHSSIDQPDSVVHIKTIESDMGIYESLETFQSRAEIKFYDSKDVLQSPGKALGQTKVIQYPGQAVQVVSVEEQDRPPSPGKQKKVGFTEPIDRTYGSVDICEPKASPKKVIASVKQTPTVQKVTYDAGKVKKLTKFASKKIPDTSTSDDLSPDFIKAPPTPPKLSPKKKKPPKRCSKTPELRKDHKQDGISGPKPKHILKRSNSDAVMSRRNDNGETVSVKIQFTKDGVKVISDKESIV